ncbi:MAG: hypothetical protein HYX84_04710 [Chloroflexi bacterium]|nr:hypothetical protein [Chloroflexota bacterium]
MLNRGAFRRLVTERLTLLAGFRVVALAFATVQLVLENIGEWSGGHEGAGGITWREVLCGQRPR